MSRRVKAKQPYSSCPVLSEEPRRVERKGVNETPNGEAGELWTPAGRIKPGSLAFQDIPTHHHKAAEAQTFLYRAVVEVLT
jgi:hypothetical protein